MPCQDGEFVTRFSWASLLGRFATSSSPSLGLVIKQHHGLFGFLSLRWRYTVFAMSSSSSVAFIYTDMVAPRDIRSSAQALINFAVLGVGLLIGGFFAGFLKDIFTSDGQTNYTWIFTIPAIITLICAIIFAGLFREERREATS
jgi:MFS family permease